MYVKEIQQVSLLQDLLFAVALPSICKCNHHTIEFVLICVQYPNYGDASQACMNLSAAHDWLMCITAASLIARAQSTCKLPTKDLLEI